MDDREAFDSALTQATDALGVPLSVVQRAGMWRHFLLMVEANRHFNLTRITEPADAALKHYADSLTLLAAGWADRDARMSVLDVGTGAGFPAVPLAIACPNWQVTAIDGTGKKARFVGDVARELELTNLTATHVRAADLARSAEPPKFDLIVMRAVTQIAAGIEESHRLINPAGAIIFYKSGTLGEEEMAAGDAEARRRRLNGAAVHKLQLPTAEGTLERRLIRYGR